jgi:GntR family transcriptional regulator, vanillate catabolism transcriptional regulator
VLYRQAMGSVRIAEQDGAMNTAPPVGPSQIVRALLGLRELILAGEFQAGDRLAELSLVARLGVSRTPLRLAMTQLEHEGLLRGQPAGGFVVQSFTLADVRDAVELRGVLEGVAARMAAERGARAEDLATAAGLVAELDDVLAHSAAPMGDAFETYVSLNERFHDLIVTMAGSPMLRRSLEQVVCLPFASPSAFVNAEARLPESFEFLGVAQIQHHDLLDAIVAREGSRAEALGREHARLALRNLKLALADHRLLANIPGAPLLDLAPLEP